MKRLLASALLAVLVPATADAATVHVGRGPGGSIDVLYDAGNAERNDLAVTYASATQTAPYRVTFHDAGATIAAGTGCTSNSAHEATCSQDLAHDISIDNPVVRLGDRDDTFEAVPGQTAGVGPGFAVSGGSGEDTLNGGRSTDTFDGGSGDDTIDGGAGNDRVSYAGRAAPVTVDLAAGTGGGPGEDDVLRQVEYADGGHANDRLAGDGQWNVLDGRGGRDVLIGRGAGDSLYGGRGRDRLVGGTDDDELFPGGGLDSLSCGAGAGDVVHAPIRGERLSRHCDFADFSNERASPSFRVPVNPFSTTRKALKFDIACPRFEEDDGDFRRCSGRIAVRTRSGRLLARGKIPLRRSGHSSTIVVARLTKLGRRLTARRRGVVADVYLRGGMPHVAWTIRLKR